MKLEVMDGPKTSAAEQPSVTVIQAEGSRDSSAGGKKSRVTRKHVIIGVTCAVVVAMVIPGVLVGVKFYLDSANELVTRTLEFRKDEDHRVKEDVGADVKENYVRYHVKDDDSEVWVINDFNRELQVMKVKQSEGSKCYVVTLNSSDNALPQAVLNVTATDNIVDTVDSYYDVSKTAIKDQSMLGAHGQELCNNLDVHWMTQTCDAGKNETETESVNEHDRDKRHVVRPIIPPPPDCPPPSRPKLIRYRCRRGHCHWCCRRCCCCKSCKWGRCCHWYYTWCYKWICWPALPSPAEPKADLKR